MSITQVWRHVIHLPPNWTWLAATVMGLLLIVLSFAVGVDSVQIEIDGHGGVGKREVGYMYALNWWFNYTLVFPFMLMFMLRSIQQISEILASLAEQEKMLLNKEWRPINSSQINSLWETNIDWFCWLMMPIALSFAIFVSYEEWYRTNFRSLMVSPYEVSKNAMDWGVGTILVGKSTLLARLSNLIFDFICFTLQAVFMFYLISYFCIMFYLGTFISDNFNNRNNPKKGMILVPNVHSNDNRRGFNIFEKILTDMLRAGLCAYVMAYLSRLQNIYLHCPYYRSFHEFIKEDLIKNIFLGGNLTSLFDPVPTCLNAVIIERINIFVIVCTLLIIAFVVVFVGYILRNAAVRARDILEERLQSHGIPDHLKDLDKLYIKRELHSMVFWPLHYVSLNMLLILCAFGALSLIFYRIGLFVLGVAVVILIMRVVKELYCVIMPFGRHPDQPVKGYSMSQVTNYYGTVTVGVAGNAHSFQQIWTQSNIDPLELAKELAKLHAAMKRETKGTPEEDEAIGAVAKAEKAAAEGDSPAALRDLKTVGTWTLKIAESIGVPVVVEIIKNMMKGS